MKQKDKQKISRRISRRRQSRFKRQREEETLERVVSDLVEEAESLIEGARNQQQTNAAIKIQAVARGKKTRKELKGGKK